MQNIQYNKNDTRETSECVKLKTVNDGNEGI